jgi:hypothetical protein
MFDRSRRNAPGIGLMLGLGALELLCGPNASDPGSGVVHADFGVTGTVLLVTAAINFLSGLFRGRVDPNVKFALEGMRTTIGDIARAIVDGLAWAGGKIAAVLLSVKAFIARTFGPLFEMLKKLVERVSRILDRIIGPIIDFLDRVRDHVWAIYRDFVKPILDVIEFIRLPLRILSAFGVDWARKLDAKLAEVEDWIADNFRMVIGKLNKAIDFLDQIVDVTGLLKRITFVRTLMRDLGILDALLLNRWHRPLTGDKLDRYGQPFTRRTIDQVRADLTAYVLYGQGPDRGRIDEHAADFRLRMRRA